MLTALYIPELARCLHSRGNSDSIVESQTKGLVSLVTTLVVEHVVLEVVANREESAALSVHELRSIGAGGTTSDRRSYEKNW